MSRRLPPAVKPGDRVAIVSPASPFNRDEFDAGLAEIARLGFEPVFDETVFAREGGYLSGSARLRADAFMRYWRDPAVAALMAVRGGFGSAHLLPLLDRTLVMATPKLFIGYSDTTALLSWLTCHCGLTALHGPMVERRLSHGADGYDERSLMALLQDGDGLVLAPDGLEAIRDGETSGPLYGGTLTQLVSSLGTPYAFDPPDGCVLFIEDVNERPYRLDRMLTQLAQSGTLRRASALVFGEMRGCTEPGATLDARDVVARFTSACAGPILFGFPSGHTTGPCWTLPLGIRVRVTARPRPSLVVEEPAVDRA